MEPQLQKLREQLNELQSTNQSLQTKNKSLETENKSLQTKNESLETKVELLEKKLSTDKKINRHSKEFWNEIENKINKKDTEYIKYLIKNKTITVHDVDDYGNTLLHFAAIGANHEIAQLCINLGADLKCKNKMGESLMDNAIGGNAPNIQQLLLFSEMKANIGERIQSISTCINKQNGVIENILNELSLIGDQSKELFLKTLNEIMIHIIQKKLVFSDDLLNLCWKMIAVNSENDDILQSELWRTIKETCNEVIKGKNKRDWFWLKQCVVPSTIWYQKNVEAEEKEKEEEKEKKEEEGTKKTSYLYYKLLDFVDEESKHQLNVLQNNIKEHENKDKQSWDELIKWNISTDIWTNKTVPRQDTIPNGIIAEYPRHQLLHEAVNISFDAAKFYDHNQYISKLLLLAQMVNDEFQKSIQKMFDIDKYTKEGIINVSAEHKYDDDSVSISYSQGPVKTLERARAKAELDYFDETYPTSACVLDFNRCTLTFRNIKSLLFALELFVNKVRYYQSGSIIAIVRVKNGWKEYVQNTTYADIKVNVVIRGQRHNIIGEVQFMLETMSTFKRVAHNLYAIAREEDFVTNSASKILPSLVNINEQRNVLAGSNDVKGLLRLMVFNNNTKEDLLSINEERNQTILTTICEAGNLKALQFVLSLMNDEEHIKYLFLTDLYNQTPIDNAVAKNHLSLVQCIFSLQCIRQKHNPNDEDRETKNALFRLIFYVCIFGEDSWSFLDNLGITKNHIRNIMHYKYPEPAQKLAKGAWSYHTYNILIRVIQYASNNVTQLKKIASIIGEEAVTEHILKPDSWNVTGLERAVQGNKLETIQYLLSLEGIKNVYNPKNTDGTSSKWIFRLLLWLFGKCKNDDIIDYVLNELNIDKEIILKSLNYEYPKEEAKIALLAFRYDKKNIVHTVKTLNRLQKVTAIVGEQIMIENMLRNDEWNINGLEQAIEHHKLDIIEYLLSFEEVQKLYNPNNTNAQSVKLIYRLLYWLFCEPENDKMIDCILNALNLDNETIAKFIQYRYPSDDYVDGSVAYHKWYIFGRVIFQNTLSALQKMVNIVGEKVLIEEVLISNGDNINGIEYAIRKHKLDIIEYLLSFEEIKRKCANDTEILWRIVFWLNVAKCDETLIKYVINTFDLNEKRLKELQLFKCPKPDTDHHFVYWDKTFSDDLINKMLECR